ncbi:hypothetical protein RJ639_038710 [Escallonia herrerae]|uniref:Protein cereblon n=1 Tax=Escallonia herrerae TaxID=1293975 RepID=A0AA88X0Q1_9ASTE|nr:hypothetical protein RJ639_038710 [Escallonia herrerae]
MEEERIRDIERIQIEHLRELDSEELHVEEVDRESSDDDDAHDRGFGGASGSREPTFNVGLASLHTLKTPTIDSLSWTAVLCSLFRCFILKVRAVVVSGMVVSAGVELSFVMPKEECGVNGGFLGPMRGRSGVVLFPEATLPLRVIQPYYIAAVERALRQADASYTIGVLHVYNDTNSEETRFATTGTTAEIRKFQRLEDGSLNPCGEIQIIQEDLPLRTPRDAVGRLAPLRNLRIANASQAKQHFHRDENEDSDAMSEESFEGDLSLAERSVHRSALLSYGSDIVDEATSSDYDESPCRSEFHSGRSILNSSLGSSRSVEDVRSDNALVRDGEKLNADRQPCRGLGWRKDSMRRLREVPRSYWPYWVYRMYDSYCLAQRLADMWKQIVRSPSVDGLVNKPDLLSFHIASKIPVSESTRQELLEIDGTSYRLRREIELLESFDCIRCKSCETLIARRSNMLVMSSEGPLGAYVNPHGYVHEIITLYKANGLAFIGNPDTEYSWFPGYAWTIAYCGTCRHQMGWRFTATNKKLKPQTFYGIRSSQVADEMH